MKNISVGLILAYQRTVSPWLGARCRFYPSCSELARQAIEKYGVIAGLVIALRRLLLCHPFHPGGYAPLEKFHG